MLYWPQVTIVMHSEFVTLLCKPLNQWQQLQMISESSLRGWQCLTTQQVLTAVLASLRSLRIRTIPSSAQACCCKRL